MSANASGCTSDLYFASERILTEQRVDSGGLQPGKLNVGHLSPEHIIIIGVGNIDSSAH